MAKARFSTMCSTMAIYGTQLGTLKTFQTCTTFCKKAQSIFANDIQCLWFYPQASTSTSKSCYMMSVEI